MKLFVHYLTIIDINSLWKLINTKQLLPTDTLIQNDYSPKTVISMATDN